MEKIKLTFSHQDTVANITLTDGKGNVLDYLMTEQLIRVLEDFKFRENLKLLVFRGEGRHFSFGASVEEHQKDYAEGMLKNFHRVFFLLRDLSIPAAALISGQCLGGGLELAIMCQFLFADKTARLGQPEVCLGVFPPPASIILPEKIGLAKAEDLLLTGRVITAEEAWQLGLVNQVMDDRQAMEDFFEAWAEKHILPKSASSLRFAAKAARIKFNHILSNFLPQLEYIYLNQLMETPDANEGIAAFLEKREPVWKSTKTTAQ